MKVPMPELARESPVEQVERGKCALIRALKDIFSSMFNVGVEVVPHEQVSDAPRISSMIGFGGEISGFVLLHFSIANACKVTAGLLRMPIDHANETVRDTVAELVNMVAGRLRNQLCIRHEPIKLSLPSVVEGLEYSTRGPAGSLELLMGVVAETYCFKVQLVMEKSKL